MKYHFVRLFALLLFLSGISGCSLLPENSSVNNDVTAPTSLSLRNKQMQKLTNWKISGKIAFIQQEERNSANFVWNKKNKTEQNINLTTYLGINVLQLTSKNNFHQLMVDGETYHGDNLDNLIYQLTQLNFPTQALTYWLKGLSYSPKDKITYQENNYLPKTLTSNYNQQLWRISYKNYKIINGHQLPTTLTITTNNLLIKIRINQWTI